MLPKRIIIKEEKTEETGKMANIKEQKLRKLKKVFMGGSIIGFLIVGTLASIALAAMVGSFFYYMMDSKLNYEYERVNRLASLYEITNEHDNEDILKLLNSDSNVYIIVDKDDRIIKEHGKNTCDLVIPALDSAHGKACAFCHYDNEPIIRIIRNFDVECIECYVSRDIDARITSGRTKVDRKATIRIGT